jgi:hypothetical protein
MMFGALMLQAMWIGGIATAQDASPAPDPVSSTAATPSKADTKLRLRVRPWRKQKALSLTISGALVADLMVEGTGEVNLPGQHAAAIILGAGAFQELGSGFIDLLYIHAGAQYRYSVLGDFDAGLYVGLDGVAQIQPLAQGTPWTLPLSPMVGFKYTAPFGLVADVNAGPSAVVSNYRPVQFAAMFNLQVGWAFGRKLIK